MPINISSIFARTDYQHQLLAVDIGPVRLHCHFFTEQEIEFDLDPRQVTEPEHANGVLMFMAQLGQVLHKEVRMTAENVQDAVIFRYDPQRNIVDYVLPHPST